MPPPFPNHPEQNASGDPHQLFFAAVFDRSSVGHRAAGNYASVHFYFSDIYLLSLLAIQLLVRA